MTTMDDECASETLQQKIERLQDHAWIGDPAQRMGELHAVIATLWAEVQGLRFANTLILDAPNLLEAIDEALKEIDYHHRDLLIGEERNHPRGSGWARVNDKLRAARDQLKGRAA